MPPVDANTRLRNIITVHGGWVRTKLPPFRAVRWVPDEKIPVSNRGRRWQEIPRVGQSRAPEWFYAADVTGASPSEPMSYPPTKEAPICGFWLAREGTSESGARVLTHTGEYCPRPTKPGTLCKAHESLVDSWGKQDQGEGSP